MISLLIKHSCSLDCFLLFEAFKQGFRPEINEIIFLPCKSTQDLVKIRHAGIFDFRKND